MTEEELRNLYVNGLIGEKTYRKELLRIKSSKAGKSLKVIKTSDLKNIKVENDTENPIIFDEYVIDKNRNKKYVVKEKENEK